MSRQATTTVWNGSQRSAQPDPEVVSKAKRRRFPAEYKLRILQKADQCIKPGELGALLRREGLYFSHLSTWRRQRTQGQLAGLTTRQRGRKAQQEAKDQTLQRLSQENERLRKQLAQADLILAAQKKLAHALEQTLAHQDTTP